MSWYFEHAGWLYTKIYQNEYFFFDLWSVVHCWSGFIIFLILKSRGVKKPFASLLTILFIYEFLEITFTYFALDIFKPETIKDQFTDIFVGMFGGMLSYFILRFSKMSDKKHLRTLNYFVIFLTSITYSWLWVGFYQYDYNQEFYNSPGINVGAFFFWMFGVIATIWGSSLIRISNIWLKWIVVWVIYIVCLFAIEYFGFVILDLHESSKANAQPLLFGLIHGTPVLHFVYIFSPFISITLYSGLKALFFKAMKMEELYKQKVKVSETKSSDIQQVTLQSNQ